LKQVQNEGLIFHKLLLHIAENTVGVPNNLSCL